MLVAFWSLYHGQACTTANLLATTLASSLALNNKCLVTQTHYKLNNLDFPLIGKNQELNESEFYRDLGIDALMRRAKAEPISSDIIRECSIDIIDNNRLNLLIGTKQQDRQTYENQFGLMLEGVLRKANKFYDYVMVDTNSGYDPITQNILKAADIIVINVTQNKHILDEFIENHKDRIDMNKVVFIFGKYDRNSRYNLKNLRRMYKVFNSSNAIGIPYCTEYHDALSDGKALKFIERNITADEDDENYEFIQSIKDAAGLLMKKANRKDFVEHGDID